MIQISYKLKKGRQALVAVVGRGTKRFELGTGVLVPDGVRFTPPKSLSGGDYNDRSTCDANLHLWEEGLRSKWSRLISTNPAATAADLRSMITTIKHREAGFDASLSGWISSLESRISKGELVNDNTGDILSEGTIKTIQYFISVTKKFIAKYEDFDFARYNSSNIMVLGRQAIIGKYKSFGASFKRYLTDDCQFGQQTSAVVMARLRWMIVMFAKEYNITIDDDMLDVIKFKSKRHSSDEDIVALDDDQFDFLIDNESMLRTEANYARQQAVIDYIIVGLLTCARKGDMNLWNETNLRAVGEEYRLRYVPEKTKRSSQAVVDLFPISERVVAIFSKNIQLYNKLMPPLPKQLAIGIKNLMKKYPIFDRDITVRNSKGEFVTKKTCTAFRAHSLRSSGITYLLSHGVPERVVRKISGHAATSMSFNVYAKVLEKNKQDLYRDVFNKFSEPTPQ